MIGGTGHRDGVALVARVEWRSEHRWAERPLALVHGGERTGVEVVDRWVEGPASAGEELIRCFIVTDGRGMRYRIRLGTSGRTTVARLSGDAAR
jgi:hypothetical protein